MQRTQAERIDRAIIDSSIKNRKKVTKKYQREKRQLELILEEMEHKLLIKMRNEYDVTLKKKHLHENEIKRIQSFESNWALKEGIFKPELQRTKELKHKLNQIFQDTKRTNSNKNIPSSYFDAQSLGKNRNIRQTLRHMVKRGTLFNYQLKTKTEFEQPVNIRINTKRKGNIDKYLRKSNKQANSMSSLCHLYSMNLDRVDLNAMDEQIAQSKRKEEIRNTLIAKLTSH